MGGVAGGVCVCLCCVLCCVCVCACVRACVSNVIAMNSRGCRRWCAGGGWGLWVDVSYCVWCYCLGVCGMSQVVRGGRVGTVGGRELLCVWLLFVCVRDVAGGARGAGWDCGWT